MQQCFSTTRRMALRDRPASRSELEEPRRYREDWVNRRRTLEQMGVSCVCESCTNHSPQISEAKISAKSRPNFDATPHEATFIVVALPPAQVPCSLSRAQGSESRTHAQYSAMPEILPLSCLPHSFFFNPPLLSLFPSRQTRPTSRRVSARLSLFFK